MRHWIVGVGLLALLAHAGSTAYDAWRFYRQAIADTHRELANVATALAQHLSGGLQAIDVLLRDTAGWYASVADALPPAAIDAELRERAAASPQVSLLCIVDAQGIERHRSRPLAAAAVDVSNRSYFAAHRSGGKTGLFISEPVAGPADDRITVVLSRRVDDDRKAFAGVASAVVDIDAYQRWLYRAINLGMNSAITLLRDDGTLIMRQPAAPGEVGRKLPAFVELLEGPPEALPSAWISEFDGSRRFVAASRVPGSPLVLAVGREESVVLGPWRAAVVHLVTREIALILLGALAVAVLVHQLRRIEAGVNAHRRAEIENDRLEAQLRQSQKMEAMGTLAGGIAHDFNNILGAILGYGELAHKASAEGSPVRRYLEQVMHAGERAKALVEHILAFSRSGVGEREPVNIQSVIEETLELLAASLPDNVRLERTLEAGSAAVVGDPTQLHQLAMNLCTNAVQAMPEGGTLDVVLERVDVAERRSLSHGVLVPGPYVRLTVADTGVGISRAVQERMFDPFFTTKAVGEGTGLGLSLVHGIVTDLGGAIDITTQMGKGTAFAIWLPLGGEAAKPAPEAARALPRGNGEAVMIVDDELMLVGLAEETLAELGYEPVGFHSSADALRAFRAQPQRFDLVLTDETMPGLTGSELAREIRRVLPGIPIILMSGYSAASLSERARAAGVTEVLRKPLQSAEIADALARVLHRHADRTVSGA